MEFLHLPEEVIEGYVLPYLRWNDLLRFRRVCKVTKTITTDYMRLHPELAPELEIDQHGMDLKNFLEMDIPTTEIFLKNGNNCADDFYNDLDEENVARFLERYGPMITSFRVDQLSFYVFGKELDFLEGLPNLQNLESGHFFHGAAGEPEKLTAKEVKSSLVRFGFRLSKDSRTEEHMGAIPKVMMKLSSLKIGQEQWVWEQVRKEYDQTGIALFECNILALEYACLPFVGHTEMLNGETVPEFWRAPERSLMLFLVIITRHIKARAENIEQKNPATKTNLKVFDFENFHDPKIDLKAHTFAAVALPDLCHMCGLNGVKLKNVAAIWFTLRLEHPKYQSPQLGVPVVSLVGFHPCVVPLDLPNLERIEIKTTSTCHVEADWKVKGRPEWPALKQLDFTVDSKVSEYLEPVRDTEDVYTRTHMTLTTVLFRFFFEDVVRPGVVDLRLKFTKEKEEVAIPKAGDIVKACPNLKKLTLVNWPGTNKALVELFEGLPELEEVSLEHCKGLGNVAFVGEDTESPVFFRLKKLRKLSLKGLDCMPKITDRLFTLVIRDLKLTHLVLTSDSPVKSVTLNGIRSLLEGCFAESIEKFPFQAWRLEDVSEAEFQELGKQFRSYNMI